MFNKILFLICAAVPNAWALTDVQIENSISSALGQLHPQDTPEFWRGLGPAAPAVMMSMLAHTDRAYYRLRLVEALQFFPGDSQVADFLKNQAENGPDKRVRDAALGSLAISQGERELEFVSKYLSDPDSETRFAAAEGLRRISGPRASARLTQYLKDEKSAWIVARLRGEPVPVAQQTLPIVATSDDRVNLAWVGRWNGYFVHPARGAAGQMVSEKTSLEVSQNSGTLSGELKLGGEKKAQFIWANSRDQAAGQFSTGSFLSGQKYLASLSNGGPSPVLEFRIPSAAGYFVFVKSADRSTEK